MYGTVIVHHLAEGDEVDVALQTAIRKVREHAETIGVQWMEPCIFLAPRPFPGTLEDTPEFKHVAEEEAARLGWGLDDGHSA